MSESHIRIVPLAVDPGQRFAPLRRELGVAAFGINLIVLEPGQRMRVHRHELQEEVYTVLEGELTILFDAAQESVLEPGVIASVGPEVRRQLVNRGERPVRVLAVGGAGDHDSRDAVAWGSWEEGGPGGSPADVPLPPDLPD